MSTIIREPVLGEIPAIIKLLKSCGLHYENEDTPPKLERKLALDHDLMLVAEKGGVIAGFVMASFDGWAGIVWHFSVLPEFRKGTGIAVLLGEAIIERLKHRGADTVYGLVLPDNVRMLRLARGRGFRNGALVRVIEKNI